MYEFKKRNNISPLRNSVRGRPLGKESHFNLGYILIIGVVIIFLIRAIGVINSHNEIGVYAYVKMLNIGMPIVKTQAYKEEDYSKNKVSIKRLVSETLGLANINLVGIIGNEISYFSGAKIDNTGVSDHSESVEKFQIDEKTIVKLTPEEIAELNDVSKAYKPSLKKALPEKPEILIYHTHNMEHYSEATGQNTNPDANVVGVGQMLTKELEEGYGISVLHDTSDYTMPDYDTAYDRSREGLKKNLNDNGSFKIIIDLHRDGVSKKSSSTATLNDQTLAQFMFVVSQNVQYYEENQKAVDDLYEIGENLFPEIIKPTRVVEYPGGINGYNQGFAEKSMIIEVGSQLNSAQESKLTAKYIARILAEYLNAAE